MVRRSLLASIVSHGESLGEFLGGFLCGLRGGLNASIAALLGCVLTACASLDKPKDKIPFETLASSVQANQRRLVIVLPGRGDTLSVLKKFHVAETIQQAMPDADVTLVELTLPYYMQGHAAQRLHEEVVLPAKQHGYRKIYLAGASMGGMGVLMYEREYPNEFDGLVLMAPYMGEASLFNEIKAAGGLPAWNAGPMPAQLDRAVTPREEWRLVQSWLKHPQRAQSVWLICGQRDRFYPLAKVIQSTLPADHFVELDGGHAWKVWTQGAQIVFTNIATATL